MTQSFKVAVFRIAVISGLIASLFVGSPTPVALAATTWTVQSAGDGTANAANCPGASCRLRDAIAAASNGDSIVFASDYTINLLSALVLDRDLTLDGAGHSVTVSGQHTVRVFDVNSGVRVTLNALTVASGYDSLVGGGIRNNGTLTVSNSTVSGNSAYYGGGIFNYQNLTVVNTTFTGNSTPSGLGGGLFNSGLLVMNNSTLSGNSAAAGNGGAIRNSASATLRNTLLANNPTGGNCSGSVANGGNNLDDGATCGFGTTSGSLSNTNPQLGALTGSPAYFPLTALSPARDTANDATCEVTDQRGVARPQGPHCDIGAYERISMPTIVVTNASDSGAGSLRQAISDVDQGGVITFDNDYTINLLNPLVIDRNLTVDGTGYSVTVSGQHTVRVFDVNLSVTANLNALTIANGYDGLLAGGIRNNGTLTVSNSTVSGNSAYYGGGIFNYQNLTVVNTTFSGNSAPSGYGGALYNSGLLIVNNSTFSDNSALAGNGGAIRNGASATLRNTLLANNPTGGNCSGPVTNGGNNLDDGATCGFGTTSGSLSNTNPQLEALTGSPAYFPLTALSPARDTGNDATCEVTDQRRVARPQGTHCDIGAYEFTPPEIDVQGQSISITDGDSTPSFSDDTDFGNVVSGGGSAAHTFTLRNTGLGTLDLTGTPRVSLSSTSDFNVSLQPAAATIAPGDNLTFEVTFAPSSNGLHTTTVSIANTDSDENPYDFTLRGWGGPACTATSNGNWTEVFPGCSPNAKHIIAPGVTVILDNDVTLSGDLEIQTGGTFAPNGKTVILTGNAAQTLSGNPLTFYTLVINKTNKTDTATVVGKLQVTKKLTITKGKLKSASDYGDVEIGAEGSLELTNDITVGGTWINDGEFIANTAQVAFDGTETQAISGTHQTLFQKLVISPTAGVFITTTPAVTDTVTNYGVLSQTQTVGPNGSVAFLQISTNKYQGLTLVTDEVTDIGEVTVAIRGNAAQCTSNADSPAYRQRCFRITSPRGEVTPGITLYTTAAEDPVSDDDIYKYIDLIPMWANLSATCGPNPGDACSVTGVSLNQGDNYFLIGGVEAPNAVTLKGLTASANPIGTAPMPILLATLLGLGGLFIALRRSISLKHSSD